MRPRAASTASASAWSTRCRSRPSSRSRATRSSTARRFSAASPTSPLEDVGAAPNRRGTTVTFTPDPEIFGADARFKPGAALQARALQGLSLRRGRDPLALRPVARQRRRPRRSAVFQFPGGLADHLAEQIGDRECVTSPALHRPPGLSRDEPGPRRMGGRLAALVATAAYSYYCNTIPTPDGGTHEAGPARRADQGHPRVRRAGRQQEGQGHHRRRRLQRRRADALACSSATRNSRARPRTA